MSLKFRATTGNQDFVGIPAGSYPAVCDMLVDLGVQPGSGAFPDRRQVYIRFEVPSERVEYKKNGRKVSGPAIIGGTFTASMNEKATLRKLIQGWRGTVFDDRQAEDFEIESILAKPCLLTVIENHKNNKTYSNISAIGPLPKGMATPVAEMEPLLYSPSNTASYGSLPEWVRKKIDAQLTKEPEQPEEPEPPEAQPYHSGSSEPLKITDDDIPF